MSQSSKLADIQRAFAAHIREPDLYTAPADIEDRRMKIYRELFYNNIEGFISSAFPIIRKLYADTHWHQMVRDFIHRHQSRTPYFLEISEEFIHYLENERELTNNDPIFLLELARYEWAELALFVADEVIPADELSASHDLSKTDSLAERLLEHIPVLSPLAWPMLFNFPVHKIGPQFQPSEAGGVPVCLVVYRNRLDKVKFLEANMVTARLLELCDSNVQRSGRELLEQIAVELDHSDATIVVNGGAETLVQLHGLDIIYTNKKAC